MSRSDNLTEVIDERVNVYGDPVESYTRIAEVWSGILGVTVNATDVPLCMIGMKLVRTQVTPDYSDNSDDVEGYLDIFRKLVGDDMIHARSVKEYLRLREEYPMIPRVVELHTATDVGPGINAVEFPSTSTEGTRWMHADGTSCKENRKGNRVVVDSYEGGPVIGGLCPNAAHD